MSRSVLPNVVKAAVPVALAASLLFYSFAPLLDWDESARIWLETITLAATAIVGAVIGAAFAVSPPSKRQMVCGTRAVAGLFAVIVIIILCASWAYTQLPPSDAEEFGVTDAAAKTIALAIPIWVGAMLAAKLGIQYGTHTLVDTAKTSAGSSSTKKSTASSLEKWLWSGAMITLAAVVAVVVEATLTTTTPPEHLESGTLFMASATIMGLAAFGSALATLGPNRGLIKSIAYALLPVIAIQAVFMASFVSDVKFPAVWWIGMTAAWLFLLVLAMVVNKIQPEGTCGDANPDGETPRSRKGKEHQERFPSCPQCCKGSVQDDDTKIPSQTFPNVDGLPVGIASLYDETRASFRAQTYTGCEMLCNKILMNTAVDKGAKLDQSFATYVKYLVDRGYVPPALKDMITAVKDNGVVAAHEIDPSGRERAEYVLEFTRCTLYTVYGTKHALGKYGGIGSGQSGADK